MNRIHSPEENIERLLEVLKPLARIGNLYYLSELDEHRPEWDRDKHKAPETVELYSGRGGQKLLTLADALNARDVYNDLVKRHG